MTFYCVHTSTKSIYKATKPDPPPRAHAFTLVWLLFSWSIQVADEIDVAIVTQAAQAQQ